MYLTVTDLTTCVLTEMDHIAMERAYAQSASIVIISWIAVQFLSFQCEEVAFGGGYSSMEGKWGLAVELYLDDYPDYSNSTELFELLKIEGEQKVYTGTYNQHLHEAVTQLGANNLAFGSAEDIAFVYTIPVVFVYSVLLGNSSMLLLKSAAPLALPNTFALGLDLQSSDVVVLNSFKTRRKLVSTLIVDILLTIPYFEHPHQWQGDEESVKAHYMSLLASFVSSGKATAVFHRELQHYGIEYQPDLRVLSVDFIEPNPISIAPTTEPTQAPKTTSNSAENYELSGVGLSIVVALLVVIIAFSLTALVYLAVLRRWEKANKAITQLEKEAVIEDIFANNCDRSTSEVEIVLDSQLYRLSSSSSTWK